MVHVMDTQAFNKAIIDEFRANKGVVGGQFAGAALLLLSTTGAKSGLARVNPLVYLADGDRQIIIASFAGAPTSPPWYHNLLANPEVGVEMGSENFNDRDKLLKDLGKHKISTGGCLYINKLEDVDLDVLKDIIDRAYQFSKEQT